MDAFKPLGEWGVPAERWSEQTEFHSPAAKEAQLKAVDQWSAVVRFWLRTASPSSSSETCME